MKRALIFLGLLAPVMVLALSFEDQTSRYTDAPFNSAVAAGVSVLTEAGAIEGNPDGTFQPDRLLNRAEFLKIVLKSYPSSTVDLEKDAGNCFPDVGQWDWFSPYVCYAKANGIVGGYPDGYFRPENSVNHAEALKMLGELYGLIEDTPQGEWYVKYRERAYGAGVGLPGLEQDMEHLLTRGEMARLAAAYLAHSQDQLEEYRAMEHGEVVSSSSSSAPAEGCCSSSSFSSSSSLSSSSSSVARWTHPTSSHFLLVGTRTPPIASGVFQFSTPMDIRTVTVEMKRKITTIDTLHLVDNRGRTLATLKLDNLDQLDKRWRVDLPAGEATVGPGSIPLGIEATMKTKLQGGFPEDFIEVKTMSMIVGDPAGIATSQALPVEWSHPAHQTAVAKIDRVENAGSKEGTMTLGTNQRIGEFRFVGRSTGASLHIENLLFTTRIAGGVTVQNWRIVKAGGGTSIPCSFSSEGVSCPMTEELGMISGGGLTLAVFGDVSMVPGTQGATLQILLSEPGSLSTFGAVQWSDGTGHYRWMEGEVPLAVGTGWEG